MSKWTKFWGDIEETESEIGGETLIVWMKVPAGHFAVRMAFLEDGEWLEASTSNPLEYPVLAWYNLPPYEGD